MRRLPAPAAALAIALATVALPARAVDRIDLTGATVAVGGAPTQGVVTVDPYAFPGSAPALPAPQAPGAIGGMTGGLPAFSAPSGGIAPFLASSGSLTLPGGTYSFTSYTVASGATVTYSGAVTIRTDGDVSIAGTVRTTGTGSSLAFEAGGRFQLAGVAESASDLSVAAAGDVDLGFGSTATGAAVTLDAHGLSAGTGDATLSTTDVSATGALTVRAAGAVTITDARLDGSGAALVQAFGGVADLSGAATTETRVRAGSGEARIEGSGGVVVTDGARIEATGDADIVVRATGGALHLDDGAVVTAAAGDVTLRASSSLTVEGGSDVTSSSGAVELTASGGDVSLEPDGGSADSTVASTSGAVTLRGSAGVVAAGHAAVTAGSALRIDAAGGNASFSDDAALTGGSSEVRASGNVVLAEAGRLGGGSVLVFAGDDIDLAGASFSSSSGELRCVAMHDARLRGTVTAAGNLTVAVLDADIDVQGATLGTAATTGTAHSGAVLVETYAGPVGDILAAGATIRSGDSEAQSGDVSILIHGPSPDGPYLLPRSVAFRPGRDAPAKSVLRADGLYETGGEDLDPSLPAKLSIGGTVVDMPEGLARDGKGRNWRFEGEGLRLRISTQTEGVHGTFRIDWTGDPAKLFAEDGSLAIRYENASHALACRVFLDRNRFQLGRDQRDLPEPRTWVASVHGVIQERGKKDRPHGPPKRASDQLRMALGFHSEGRAPAVAPDVRVTFGPAFTVTLPGTAARRSGNRFSYRVDADRARHALTIDWDRGLAGYDGKGIDLGRSIAPGRTGVSALLSIGDEDHVVRFRVVRNGRAIRY